MYKHTIINSDNPEQELVFTTKDKILESGINWDAVGCLIDNPIIKTINEIEYYNREEEAKVI